MLREYDGLYNFVQTQGHQSGVDLTEAMCIEGMMNQNDQFKRIMLEYPGKSTDELIALENTYDSNVLVYAFEQALYKKQERLGAHDLTEEEYVIIAIESINRDVYNGGFSQYFINHSKKYSPRVVDAFKSIDRPDIATIVQQAIDVLGIKGALTVDAIDDVFYPDDAYREDDERDERLNDLDDKYNELADDSSENLFAFIKAHRQNICL